MICFMSNYIHVELEYIAASFTKNVYWDFHGPVPTTSLALDTVVKQLNSWVTLELALLNIRPWRGLVEMPLQRIMALEN